MYVQHSMGKFMWVDVGSENELKVPVTSLVSACLSERSTLHRVQRDNGTRGTLHVIIRELVNIA
jgi:hypothetical protein